jgi:Ca2+-binding EF-hand superfamily protein
MEANTMKRTIIALAALTFAGSAFAQDTSFATADADQSGDLTFTEVTAVLPNVTEEAFTAADTDGNGTLSEAEYTALLQSSGG